jgi:hypothetical protein
VDSDEASPEEGYEEVVHSVAVWAAESAEAAPRAAGLSAEKRAWAESLACLLAKPEARAVAVPLALATSAAATSDSGARAEAEAAEAGHLGPLEGT